MKFTRRGTVYYLRKRVPKRYRRVEARETVWVSLHTDSETAAGTKAPAAWSQMIEGWEAKLAGDTEDAERRFEAARELAQVRGFRYLIASRVANLPREELLERIEAVPAKDGRPDGLEASALLGGAKEPPITVSRALELYWALLHNSEFGRFTT